MSPLPSPTRDAFDDRQFWLSSASSSCLAYASWIAGHPLQENTKRIYAQMWCKFARWLEVQGVALDVCEAHHLSLFLNHSGLERAHRQRYVRLIERTYVHLNAIGLCAHNPGQQAGYEKIGAGTNEPTRFLSLRERERLFAALRGAFSPMAEGAEPVKKTQEAKKTKKEEGSIGPSAVQWAVLRDAAIAAVMVGGGVKVAELVAMTVSCTLWEKALKIPARGNVREHMAMLLPIGEEALDAWMPQRESIGLAGDILFPAAMDRRRHDQRVKTASLNPSSVFRRVAALLSSCGITGERASGQTLRNTYAAMLIESGADNEALMECLGLFALSSAERLRLQHEAWLASGADA